MRHRIASQIDRIIFADLVSAAILSVLAFGTVEPWSIAVFELNALALLVLLSIKHTLIPPAHISRFRIALPVAGLLALAICQLIPAGAAPMVASPEDAPLAALGARAISFDPQATREAAARLLALVIYLICAIESFRGAGRRRLLLAILTAFGFAVSLFAIVQRFTSNGKMYWFRPVSPYIAPYGPYGNYNHFSGLVELILPLPLAWLLIAGGAIERRVISLLGVVIMAVALIFSLSRGGMLALGVEAACMVALLAIAGRRLGAGTGGARTVVALASVSVLAMALWIGYQPLIERFGGTLRQGAGEYSVVTRLEYWRASLRIFLDHPIAGVGLGAFPAAYPAYGRSTAKYERLEQAHNDYLQLLTDAGIAGALIGLWFAVELALLARRAWQGLGRLRGSDRAIACGAIVSTTGIAVHSLLDFNLQIAANELLFLFVVALLASTAGSAADSLSRNDSIRKEEFR